MQPIIEISGWQLALFMLIVLVPLAINWRLQLHLARETLIAVARMSVQLLLVGLYLQWLFEFNSLLINVLWLSVMLLVGASAITNGAKLSRKHCYAPIIVGLVVGLLPLLSILLVALLQPAPVYHAQYLIPLAGMLLGNSLSGNIVALQHLFNSLEDKRLAYEGALALGATPTQACADVTAAAIKQSLTPVLASMSTTGLVTLPGMMTGQILSGVDPMIAIKYQLVIMVAIFVMASVSITVSLQLTVRNSIDSNGKVLL